MQKTINFYFLTLLSTSYSHSSEITEEQILRFFKEQYQEISSEDLLLNPEITSYSYPEMDSEIADPLHRRFAELRIETKHEVYPTLTLEDKERLKSDGDFMASFIAFLKNWYRTEFYASLAARALDLSRGVPSSEFPLGNPTLPSEIRGKNHQIVSKLDELHQSLYEPLDAYMRLMSRTHGQTISFLEFLTSKGDS